MRRDEKRREEKRREEMRREEKRREEDHVRKRMLALEVQGTRKRGRPT